MHAHAHAHRRVQTPAQAHALGHRDAHFHAHRSTHTRALLCPWFCLSVIAGYDEEARYFETGVSDAKREELVDALEAAVRPAFDSQLALLRELALTVFKQQLDMEGPAGETFVERAHRWGSGG